MPIGQSGPTSDQPTSSSSAAMVPTVQSEPTYDQSYTSSVSAAVLPSSATTNLKTSRSSYEHVDRNGDNKFLPEDVRPFPLAPLRKLGAK